MKYLAVLALSVGLTPWPAFAESVTVQVVNNSSQVVDQVVGFHVAEDGSVIDDVVGSHHDPIQPGERVGIELGGPCQPSSLYVRLASGKELSARLDTCVDRALAVSD